MSFADLNFVAHTRTIVSIYPEPLVTTLNIGPTMAAGNTIYRLDGAPKGEYRILSVADGFSPIIDYQACQVVGRNPMTSVPEPAEKICRELVRQWTTGAGSGAGNHPGVMMIASTDMTKQEPTKAELTHLQAVQSRCFEWLVLEARAFEANHKWTSINEKHRIAGKWLGLKDKWIAEVGTEMDKGVCAFCFSALLNPRATVCAICHKDQPTAPAAKQMPLPPPIAAPVAAQHAAR